MLLVRALSKPSWLCTYEVLTWCIQFLRPHPNLRSRKSVGACVPSHPIKDHTAPAGYSPNTSANTQTLLFTAVRSIDARASLQGVCVCVVDIGYSQLLPITLVRCIWQICLLHRYKYLSHCTFSAAHISVPDSLLLLFHFSIVLPCLRCSGDAPAHEFPNCRDFAVILCNSA